MKQRTRRFILIILVSGLSIFFGLNILLAGIDPLGVVRYQVGIEKHMLIWQPDSTGYQYPPADYDFGAYEARMRRNRYRDVPLSVYADCSITFIGDSFTFGLGVSDWDTFANVTAAAFDNVEIRNAGQIQYNIGNIARVVQDIEALTDGMVYLVYDNDYYPDAAYYPVVDWVYFPLLRYLRFAFVPHSDLPIPATFEPSLASVLERENLLAFVFRGSPLADIATRHGAITIPQNTTQVSRADVHPDANGHREIAAAMHPYLIEFLEMVCHD
jgi:hypothetical protein